MSKNKHVGSAFDDFLKEEGIYEEVQAAASTRVISWQIEKAMEERHSNKQDLARLMRTSRTQVDRLLDPNNHSIQINTLQRAAAAVGRELIISLRPISTR